MTRCLAVMSVVVFQFCCVHAEVSVFYATDFDELAPGPTQHHPGDEAQDGWYYGDRSDHDEIQDAIVVDGRALRLSISLDDNDGDQTSVKRELTPPDLSQTPMVTLEADFYAVTSDQEAVNEYAAHLDIFGGPHPGFLITGFSLSSGNGIPKNIRKVNVGLACFNGIDNNVPVPLSVGQGLDWETWHHVKLVIDQRADRYVSLMVNGETQPLGNYALPRSPDEGVWKRGQLIEQIQTLIAARHWDTEKTADAIYWDNIALYGRCPLKADLSGDCKVDMEDLAIFAAEWLMGT
ncbi:MAG: hypothetical protein GXY41_11125 [Phycisphaerae bacterium]|nr:hypothetical protein [Phycisphaerae bacterium]